MHLVGFDVSNFVTVVDDKKITFEGCNKAEVSYEARADGYFKVLSSAVLTKKACYIDFDTKIIDAFKSADKYAKSEYGFYFTKAGKRVIELNFKKTTTTVTIEKPTISLPSVLIPVTPIKIPVAGYQSLKGAYNAKITGSSASPFACSIDDKQITFTGCNQFSIPYDAHIDGLFKTNLASFLTKNTCKSNFDN